MEVKKQGQSLIGVTDILTDVRMLLLQSEMKITGQD